MFYKVTSPAKRVRTQLLLRDANERTSCLVTLVKPLPISRDRVLNCENRCKLYLSPNR